MIPWNVWVQVGVVNKAKGTLKGLVYSQGAACATSFDSEMVQRVKLERGATTRRLEMTHKQGVLVIPTGSKLLAIDGAPFRLSAR